MKNVNKNLKNHKKNQIKNTKTKNKNTISHSVKSINTARKCKKIRRKNRTRCSTSTLLLFNLIISSFQLAEQYDSTIPKFDDSEKYMNFNLENETSIRSGTRNSAAELIAQTRSANWLDGQIRRIRLLPSNKLRNRLIKLRNGNGMKTFKIIHWNMWNKIL